MKPDVGHIAHFHGPANNIQTPYREIAASNHQVSWIDIQFSNVKVKRTKISVKINIS